MDEQEDENIGHIYIRNHEAYDKYDAYKLGKSQNCISRESGYISGEIKRGEYILVLQVLSHDLDRIEIKLQKYFKKKDLHVSFPGGGTEFFRREIKNLIVPYLQRKGFEFKKLDPSELARSKKLTQIVVSSDSESSDSESSDSESSEENIKGVILRDWQEDLVKDFRDFINSDKKAGIIIAPTGCGKSYIMNYLAIFEYIKKFNCDCLIMTKRKEILDNEFINKGNEMIRSNNLQIEFINLINGDFDWEIFSKNSKSNRIFIINTDKFIMSPKFSNYKSYSYGKIKLALLDECHWSGADKLSDFLIWLKSNIVNKLIGFSATPVRINEDNQSNTKKVFSHDGELNVIYTRSYMEAIKDGDRVQTKWLIIPTTNSDLVEVDDIPDEQLGKTDRVLNKSGFKKFAMWLNDFISQSLNKKGIIWFANKKNLKIFNEFINDNKNSYVNLKQINFICSYSKSQETDIDTIGNLETFKSTKTNSILLAVFRATEGFDDPSIDFGFNLYTTESSNPLLDQQKEGRVSRNFPNKIFGYFGFLYNQSVETYETTLVKRLGDWINYIKEYESEYTKISKKKKPLIKEHSTEEYVELLLDSANIKTIEISSIKNKIFNYCESFTGSVSDIKKILQKANKKSLEAGTELVDTEEKYNEYAKTKTNWVQSNAIKLESQNWVELLRPDFSQWKTQFYTWSELCDFCHENKITNIQTFKEFAGKNKVPDYNYILSGMYNSPKFYKDINTILYTYNQFELLL
jgi:superfamily II DNA or RNA helicase